MGRHGQGLGPLGPRADRFVHFHHDPADPTTLAGERVQLIQEDRQGRFWIATYGTGSTCSTGHRAR